MSDPPSKPCGSCNKKGLHSRIQTPSTYNKTNVVQPKEQDNNEQKNVKKLVASLVSGPCAGKILEKTIRKLTIVQTEEQNNIEQENVYEDVVESIKQDNNEQKNVKMLVEDRKIGSVSSGSSAAKRLEKTIRRITIVQSEEQDNNEQKNVYEDVVESIKQDNNEQKNVKKIVEDRKIGSVSSGPCADERLEKTIRRITIVQSEEQDNNEQENVWKDVVESIEQDNNEQKCLEVDVVESEQDNNDQEDVNEEVVELELKQDNNDQENVNEEVVELELEQVNYEQEIVDENVVESQLEQDRNIELKYIQSPPLCVCKRSEKTICEIRSSVEFVLNNIKEDVHSKLDHLKKDSIRNRKQLVSFLEPRSSMEVVDCEGRIISQKKDKYVSIQEIPSKNLDNQCSEHEICSYKEDELYKTDNESDDTISEPLAKNRGKHYYYTNPETTFLREIKKLFKVKKKKTSKLCRRVKVIEKIPDHSCRVKVEAWEKHDKAKCSRANTDYKYVGQLLFPVCSKDIFYEEPGVIARKSMKSFYINDPNKFRQPVAEIRQYAYPDTVIPRRLLEWSLDDVDVSVVKKCPAKLEQPDPCTCSY